MTEQRVLRLDGRHLTVEDIVCAARGECRVELTAESMGRLRSGRATALEVASTRPVYGFSTGVGANRNVPVTDFDEHLAALLTSHSTAMGQARSADRVKAAMVVRLNQLAAGGSGIEPKVVEAFADLINSGAVPLMRELGSIGTADLHAFARVAGDLRKHVAFGRGSALPFMSSNAAALADAALAASRARALAHVQLIVAAISFAGARGNGEAFAAAAEHATPFRGSRKVCRVMRDLLDEGTPARIQDPYGLRALPQVNGSLLDALDDLENVVQAMANVAAENPTFARSGVAHHAAFHAARLAQVTDMTTSALAQAGQLTLARILMLHEPAITGLEPFLGFGRAGASGTMMIEYVAADLLGEMRALAAPASIQTVSLSRGVEEDASFAALAGRQLMRGVAFAEQLVAAELAVAVRAVRQRAVRPRALRHLPDECRGLSTDMADRDLSTDLDTAWELVRQASDHAEAESW